MNPNDESVLLAREIYDAFDTPTRLFYALFYVQNNSTQEIARKHYISRETVVACLKNVEKELTEELHYKLVHFLTLALKELEDARDAFCQQYHETAKAHTEELTFAQMIAAHAATPGIMEQAGQVVANDIPVFLETAAATGMGVAATSKTFLSSALIALTMPFLWFMSMMLTGKAMGLALVREAPTLYAKRWLTRQLFVSYSGIVALPFLVVYTIHYLNIFFDADTRNTLTSIFGAIIFLGASIYIPWAHTKYQKIQELPEQNRLDLSWLNRFIYLGMGALTTLSLSFLLFVLTSAIPTIQQYIHSESPTNAIFPICMTTGFGLLLFLYHSCGYYLFGELLMTVQNNETQESSEMIALTRFWKKAKSELVFMWPFILFTIGPNIIHLFTYRTRIVIACLELAVVSLVWLQILQLNMRSPKYRMRNIFVAFLIMFVAMFLLRRFVYHPYDM